MRGPAASRRAGADPGNDQAGRVETLRRDRHGDRRDAATAPQQADRRVVNPAPPTTNQSQDTRLTRRVSEVSPQTEASASPVMRRTPTPPANVPRTAVSAWPPPLPRRGKPSPARFVPTRSPRGNSRPPARPSIARLRSRRPRPASTCNPLRMPTSQPQPADGGADTQFRSQSAAPRHDAARSHTVAAAANATSATQSAAGPRG